MTEPHAYIQWQGTDVCADVHCVCGEHTHVDMEAGQFFEFVCPACSRLFSVDARVDLIEMQRTAPPQPCPICQAPADFGCGCRDDNSSCSKPLPTWRLEPRWVPTW